MCTVKSNKLIFNVILQYIDAKKNVCDDWQYVIYNNIFDENSWNNFLKEIMVCLIYCLLVSFKLTHGF